MTDWDLRNWIEKVRSLSQLQVIQGAHWDLEIGGLTEMICKRHEYPPAILFRNIPGFSPNHRILCNPLESIDRLAMTVGLPENLTPVEFVNLWRKKIINLKPIEPETINDGPIFENVREGKDVNLFEFPVPKWHDLDGGRYIGTANLVITRDPEENWVNVGTYRVMLQGKDELTICISPGKHGRLQMEKAKEKGQTFPVALCFGQDPLLFIAASTEVPYGLNEYAYAGAIRGKSVKVVKGPRTGLPMPACAEIAMEGEITFDKEVPEGPFGEWTGYYASPVRPEFVTKIHAVYFRNDPILCGAPPMKPSVGMGFYRSLLRSALLWNALENAGVPEVHGVSFHPAADKFLSIISIKQRYPGHAKQAAIIASQCRTGAYLGRYVIVVDDDIDPFNTNDVIWALGSRSDPENSIDIIRQCWSSAIDPIIPKDMKGNNSLAIIDATKPFKWKDSFPKTSALSRELEDKLLEKWKKLFS